MARDRGKREVDDKVKALRKHHALNPHPEKVLDEAFTSGEPFFDSRDLVQVKYEMLRRVREEKQSVKDAAFAFGFSRPSFYKAKKDYEGGGIPGLLPKPPGPKRAHKLNHEVMDFVEGIIEEKGPVGSRDLAQMVGEHFGISVHQRSIERALIRRKKNT